MKHPQTINWPPGLSIERFVNDYWQRKPLLIRNAFPDFENPLSPDELGGLALDEDVNSRLILQQSEQQWIMQRGPFSEDELTSLPTQGWSLLVSDIEKHLDGFHQYLQPFRFIPDWQIDDLMISYAPAGASVGAHIDEYDVFLVQAGGKREWSIDTKSNADKTFIPDLDIKILQNFYPNETWVLEPGDMLYLPPGVPHHGVSVDNQCMTWSIGFRAISHAELVSDIAGQIASELSDTARYRDSGSRLQSHSGEITSETLSELRILWNKLIDIDAQQFYRIAGNILTQRADTFISENSQLDESIDELLANDTIVRDPASRVAFTKAGSGILLHADGESYRVTYELASLLCDSHTYSHANMSEQANHDQNSQCLQTLWQRGILLPAN